MEETYQFEGLVAWQKARELVKSVYQLTDKFPAEERFGLTNQVRRAVVSIPSNIAEGSGRISYKEKVHFLEIAFGSQMETYCQLQLGVDLGYISNEDFVAVKPLFFETSRLISGLRKSFEAKL